MCYRWKRLPISSVAEQRNIEMLHEVSREHARLKIIPH